MEIGAQHRQRHFAKARKQQRFGFMEGLGERRIHGLLDETARSFGSVADGEKRGTAKRGVDVAERHLGKIAI